MFLSGLKAMFSRFKGPFFSLTILMTLAVAMVVSLGSALSNLYSGYDAFLSECGSPTYTLYTDINPRGVFSGIKNLEEVETIETRLRYDVYCKRDDGRSLVTRIFTYEDSPESLTQPYFAQVAEHPSEDLFNIALSTAFAKNNGFEVGDVVDLGFFDTYLPFYVSAIFDHPYGINIRANPVLNTDDRDFGLVMVEVGEFAKTKTAILDKLKEQLGPRYEELKQEYPEVAVYLELLSVDPNQIKAYANEVLVKGKSGYSEDEVAYAVDSYLGQSVDVKERTKESNSLYEVFMTRIKRIFFSASLMLPIFFFLVALTVLSLSLNQIVKIMTPDIGTMLSLGITHRRVIALLSGYAFLVVLASSILGIAGGAGLTVYLTSIFRSSYFIPIISSWLLAWPCFLAFGASLFVAFISILLASSKVFRITPKDAMANDETNRRNLPLKVEKTIGKFPLFLRLTSNSIAQNPRRFAVSSFAILASVSMIALASLFGGSIREAVSQTVELRMDYTALVYLNDDAGDETFRNELEGLMGVSKVQETLYTYVAIKHGDYELDSILFGIDASDSLVVVPGLDGRTPIEAPKEGIILPDSYAERLHVRVGESVSIGNASFVVEALSKQYMNLTCYAKQEKVAASIESYVTAYFVQTSDENALLSFVAKNRSGSLVVSSKSLRDDIRERNAPMDSIVTILMVLSFGMGFTVLFVTARNQLIEQKRYLCVLCSLGYQVRDVSAFWGLQRVMEFLFALVFAIPAAIGLYFMMAVTTSTETIIYPFLLEAWHFFLALGAAILTLTLTHALAMGALSRWNLAENTRSRE